MASHYQSSPAACGRATIHVNNDLYLAKAEALAHELNIPINTEAEIILQVDEKLSLIKKGSKPLSCDFSWQTLAPLRSQGKQVIIAACKPKAGKVIIDATAGWGKDAALLAAFGSTVIMLERNPLMAALIEDGLARQTDEDRKKVSLSLIKTDAITYLTQLATPNYPDVIYCDPMHPTRDKSALVKNNMQLLQTLIGHDEDALSLLEIARLRAHERVVVKWPASKPALMLSSHAYVGKTIRYDVYCN